MADFESETSARRDRPLIYHSSRPDYRQTTEPADYCADDGGSDVYGPLADDGCRADDGCLADYAVAGQTAVAR